MDWTTLLQITINGILTGGLYALIAVGLALIWGLMGLVNFAHGDLLMLGMYLAFWIWSFTGIDPIVSVIIVGPFMYLVGVLIYRLITSRVLRAERYAQIFSTFGLSILLRAVAQYLWSPNFRMVTNPVLAGSINIGDIVIGRPLLVAGIVAFILAFCVYVIMRKTDLGRALSATAEDRATAQIMGINSDRMFSIAWGISGMCVGVAGSLMASYMFIFPDVGIMFSMLSPAIVALGGFGSIPGTVIAAFLVGVVQNNASFYLMPALKFGVVYVIYIIVVVARPSGLMGEVKTK